MSDMKAIVYYGLKDIRIEQIPIPNYDENEILVKIEACAVCGTDLKSYNYGNPRIKAPIVMGHEFVGIIEKVGIEIDSYKIGDRVVMATSVSCGNCFYCNKGWKNLCINIAPMGFSYDGGMSEYVIIPELAIKNGHLVKVPINVSAKHASLAEPLSCAINACWNSNIQPGDTVVIMGAGPMGLMNVAVAKALGAGKIILSEVNEERLLQAQKFNIDILVNSNTDDLLKIVKDTTNGIGADVAIVAAPASFPQETAAELVRKKGTVCLFASLPAGNEMLTINSRLIHYGEINIVGSSDSTAEHVTKAVEMINAGQIDADKLVTHILGFNDIYTAFELMESGESLRVVLKP